METTFKHTETTRIINSFHGWMGETTLKVNGQAWVITTMKRHSGIILSNAQPVNDEGKGSYSFVMFQDKSIALIQERGKATEAKIKDLHYKALAIFDEKSEAGELPNRTEDYKIEVGQVVFLNGYGQDEHSHERKAVYQIDEKMAYCVNLETLALTRHELYTIRDINDKFGIGIYYKQGDTVDQEILTNAVIEAKEKEKREAEREASEKLLVNAERQAKIEIGAERLKAIPAGAVSVIVAELRQNESDPMTDYYGSSILKTVYLAFSTHKRDLFAEMRKAAVNFEETKHLGPGKGIFKPYVLIGEEFKCNGSYYRKGEGSSWHNNGERPVFHTKTDAQQYIQEQPELNSISFDGVTVPFTWTIRETEIEHREKYSMGEGYYLGESSRSGWIIQKRNIGERTLEALQIAIAEDRYFIPGENGTREVLENVEGVKAVQYSDKSIVLYGNTYPIKDEIKANGGRFNKFLKINGETVQGWVFQASSEYAKKYMI